MRSPFPSAAQAYAESIDSATASRHHPDARLTILPLPSLAALYPLDTHTPSSPPSSHTSSTSSSPAVHHLTPAGESTHRNSHVHLLHGNNPLDNTLHPFAHNNSRNHYQSQSQGQRQQQQQPQQQHHHHYQQPQQKRQHQRQHHPYQSFDGRYQKNPQPNPIIKPSVATNMLPLPQPQQKNKGGRSHEFLGTSMESLLDAIEVHPALSSASSPSRSPSPMSPLSSPLHRQQQQQGLTSPPHSSDEADPIVVPDSHRVTQIHATKNNNKGRMSISHILDNNNDDDKATAKKSPQQQERRSSPKAKASSSSPKALLPKANTSPNLGSSPDINKRKWSNLSSANFEEERNAKIRRSIQDHVSAQVNRSPKMMATKSSTGSSLETQATSGSSSIVKRQVFDSKDPSTRYQMTTICCLHASVAQKSYGSEKRFLCPPPIVQIQAPQDDHHSNSGLSNKPQVTMSVICDSGDGNNSNPPGQRSTLEDDHSGTFRYLYVTGTAKAKAFQLKLQVYGRACLPNGFVNSGEQQTLATSGSSPSDEMAKSIVHAADLPEPYAVFDSAPITIISKPSKKTAKARNVSSCILAGSLVSLFNRINSQTVRTKYMSVQDGEFCAKNSNWSAFSITIVSNGPTCPAARMTSPKITNPVPSLASSSSSTAAVSASTPITYGAEIILTENATGLQSDRLIICKVENGRILENATGPICQMQKVALQSLERDKNGQHVYLSAVGNDHQVGRYMDHSTSAKTVLRYQPSTMTTEDHPSDIMKPGSDDFLCWTIVGISKFEYTYFESLPAEEDAKAPHPITPFPTLLKNPVYNTASHTLELVVSNFYSQLGNQPSQVPMNVWLGSRGPLTTHIIRSTATAATASGSTATSTSESSDQTTLLVDLPQGKHMGVSPEETSIALPLLFVRNSDGITYNSRAKVVFTRLQGTDRWTVHMA
ncbi:hypothetical protein BGZ83_003464 [Gryganskiella cystojenkinii]|nr:hypothetical protein BGZ83_003464 [Gryganskiella cystojenkinii]